MYMQYTRTVDLELNTMNKENPLTLFIATSNQILGTYGNKVEWLDGKNASIGGQPFYFCS